MKILIVSEVGWGFLRQRHHEVALHFASKGWEVTFIGPTLFRIPTLKRIFNKVSNSIQSGASNKNLVAERVKIETPENLRIKKSFIIPNTFFKYWNTVYSKYLLKTSNFNLIYSFTPSVNEIICEKKMWERLVFDIIHNWWNIPSKPEDFDNKFEFLMQNAGAIVTDSSDIFKRLNRRQHSKQKHLMLPGLNLPKNYSVKSRTKDNNTLKFLFFGNLRQNSDIELLNKLASIEYVSITVIGIMDASIINQVAKEIEYRGSMSQGEIFDISAEFDGLLLPYKQDAFSTTISPAKFYECLVMDRLIITRSDLSIFKGYEDYILQLNDLERIDYNTLRSTVERHDANLSYKDMLPDQYTWDERLNGLDKFLKEGLDFG